MGRYEKNYLLVGLGWCVGDNGQAQGDGLEGKDVFQGLFKVMMFLNKINFSKYCIVAVQF